VTRLLGQGLAGSPGKGNDFRLGAVRKAIRHVSRRHVIGKARRGVRPRCGTPDRRRTQYGAAERMIG